MMHPCSTVSPSLSSSSALDTLHPVKSVDSAEDEIAITPWPASRMARAGRCAEVVCRAFLVRALGNSIDRPDLLPASAADFVALHPVNINSRMIADSLGRPQSPPDRPNSLSSVPIARLLRRPVSAGSRIGFGHSLGTAQLKNAANEARTSIGFGGPYLAAIVAMREETCGDRSC